MVTGLTPESSAAGEVRRQEVPGLAVIWWWHGSTSFVRHEVRCELADVRRPDGTRIAARGAIHYEVCVGEDGSLPRRQWRRSGVADAEELVGRIRGSGADKVAANRLLRSLGCFATEHTSRAHCNCSECDAVNARGQCGETSGI